MVEQQIGHRKSSLVLTTRFPVVKRRSRYVVKSAYYLYGYVPPNGVVPLFWSSWFRMGYPFQRRFLERGTIFRTHESSSFVSSHLKLFKDRLLLKIRFNALTSKLLYSCCTLEQSIKNWPISRTGYQFWGKLFLERGANLESRAAHNPPKKYPSVPPRVLKFLITW